MEKNDVFEFTAPNRVAVTAVCLGDIACVLHEGLGHPKTVEYLCYAQNTLFTYVVKYITEPVAIDTDEFGDDIFDYQEVISDQHFGRVIVDYAILPYYDEMLKNYSSEQNV